MKIASEYLLKRLSGDPLGISFLGFGWFSLVRRWLVISVFSLYRFLLGFKLIKNDGTMMVLNLYLLSLPCR